MSKLYWRFRHRLWELREAWTVQMVLHYMGNHDVMYVHPKQNEPATLIVVRVKDLEFQPANYNHTHIEGR